MGAFTSPEGFDFLLCDTGCMKGVWTRLDENPDAWVGLQSGDIETVGKRSQKSSLKLTSPVTPT
jgi:hypothetical protein